MVNLRSVEGWGPGGGRRKKKGDERSFDPSSLTIIQHKHREIQPNKDK